MTTVARDAAAPLVSVLMTSYNREAFIAEAIESVLSQTFADFELIVCDDGSTDRTVGIAREYERRDPRVRVVVNERNLGDYLNRNRAAQLARGQYVKYHDSDDVMYPHCLAVMVAALESEARADFALSGSRSWSGGPCPMLLTPRLAYERELFGTGLFHLGPSCALFRADFFKRTGGFPTAGAASDYVFWWSVCTQANVLLVAGDLFYYRIHPGQELSNPRSAVDYARARGRAWQILNSPDCPLQPADRTAAKRNFVFGVARDAYYHLRAGRYRSALAFAKYSGLGPAAWLRYLRTPRRSLFAGTPAVRASRAGS